MVWVRSPAYFYKRGEMFYFSRAVPSDLQHRFDKWKVEVSLRTKSESRARKSVAALSDRLERYWDSLRMELIYSRELGLSVIEEGTARQASKLTFDEVLELYHRLKGVGKTKLFFEGSERSIRYLKDCLGHNSVDGLMPGDAGLFRDYLLERGMSASSVKRVIASVRAILNLVIKERGLSRPNIFNGVFIPKDLDKRSRPPVPSGEIQKIQNECKSADDEPRWLIALISDTGVRLAEACGLLCSDIKLTDAVPHLVIREHPWRRLKTSSSNRDVPLVGAALWAAKRIMEQPGQFAFPKYCSQALCKANSASTTLNKWLRPRVSEDCVIHSFRHSLRDRLRAVECPPDIADAIGGWTTVGVGQGYGKGYGLAVKRKWMQQFASP
jgi:integrase